jgi:Uma2 family endonuclease
LPNQALRSPDVSWIKQDRWDALTPDQKAKFPPIAPDFVLELMSPSDDLNDTQAKMREYIENGVQLGWLINRKTRSVEVYRPNQVESLDAPATLSGEAVLPGFVLNVRSLW